MKISMIVSLSLVKSTITEVQLKSIDGCVSELNLHMKDDT